MMLNLQSRMFQINSDKHRLFQMMRLFKPTFEIAKISISQRNGGVNTLKEIRNLDEKRVCDISEDRKHIVISKKDCKTIISVAKDGTLQVSHLRSISSP